MEVEVPRTPEVSPARMVLRLVGSGLQPRLERDIAKSTAQPIKMERPSCEREAIAHAPANEPGMQAMTDMPTRRHEVSRYVRASVKWK